MRRLLTALTALTFAACGDGPTGTEGPPTGPPSLAILSGDRQETAVEDTIPFQAEVRLTRGGDPVPGQLADWRVTMDGCGEPFVTTTESDSTGIVKNRAIAGTRAHTRIPSPGYCTMEVRWIDQSTGEAVRDTTIVYRVVPGEAAEVERPPYSPDGPCDAPTWEVGDTVSVERCFNVLDEYGNPLPVSDAPALSWRFTESGQSAADSGYVGTGGWTVNPVPGLHRHGWVPSTVSVDTTVSDPNYPGDTTTVRGFFRVWAEAIGPMGLSTGSAHMGVDIRMPVCWEAGEGHEGEVPLSGVEWTEGCVQPWESW